MQMQVVLSEVMQLAMKHVQEQREYERRYVREIVLTG